MNFNFNLLKKIDQYPQNHHFEGLTNKFNDIDELSKFWIISQDKLLLEINALKAVSQSLKVYDSVHEKCKRLSKRYLHGHGFFFIGRDVFFPLALVGALKLKEISYLHAEGYPAGEMKHGPIALADPNLFTIALLPKNLLFEKTK